jgi:HEAT repeat protein
VRRNAAAALGRIGPAAKDAVPELVKLLNDPDTGVRWAAVIALGSVEPGAKDAAPELVRLLKDPDGYVRRAAASALQGIGPAAKDAVPELVKLLRDPDGGVRGPAVEVLGSIGPAAKDAVPELVKLLRAPPPYAGTRGPAALALGRTGPAAKDAIPELAELLKDPNPRVRREAAHALGDIAEGLTDRNVQDDPARRHLEDVLKCLDTLGPLPFAGEIPGIQRIKRAVHLLEALERAPLTDRASSWLQTTGYKDWKTWIVVLSVGWLVIIFTIFLT